MTHELSSLMDGELDAPGAERAIQACCASGEQKQTWYLYHAIGDAMRGQAPRRLALPDEVMQSLKTQPTVLAPRRRLETVMRAALAAAASVATVGVVGWIGMQGGPGAPAPMVAKSGPQVQPVANTKTIPAGAASLDLQDYLAVHRQMPSPELYRQVNNRAPAAR